MFVLTKKTFVNIGMIVVIKIVMDKVFVWLIEVVSVDIFILEQLAVNNMIVQLNNKVFVLS